MDILNQLARSLLQIGGMTPQQIRQQTRAARKPKPMPKANTKRPAPKPAEQLVGNNQRQTNLFSQSGKPRDFRNPNVSANRPATTGPNLTRTPRLPAGAPKPPAASPGQLSLFGLNPNAKPSGNFRAPSVPGAGAGVLRNTYGADALKWLKSNSAAAKEAAAVSRAVRAQNVSNATGPGLGGLALILQAANMLQDQMLSPEQLKVKQANSIGRGITGDFQTREQVLGRNEQYGPPAPQMYGPGGSPTGSGYGQAQQRDPMSVVQPGGLFYRGNGQQAAPQPQQPQAQPSAYAPQAARPARPNRPVASAPPAPQPVQRVPATGLGDVRGQQFGTAPTGEFQASDMDPYTQNGVDMERRRAFLDADNSLDGMKAVRDLLKRRKLSITVSD